MVVGRSCVKRTNKVGLVRVEIAFYTKWAAFLALKIHLLGIFMYCNSYFIMFSMRVVLKEKGEFPNIPQKSLLKIGQNRQKTFWFLGKVVLSENAKISNEKLFKL
jgi:hypothetical protein